MYCIIFCFCDSNAHASNKISRTTEKSNLTACVADAPDFYCHIINTGYFAGTILTLRFKNIHTGLPEFAQITQSGYRLKFSPYVFYSGNLLIRLLKSDIIFPFHYFW